jgi:hypothetical protein
MSGQNGHKEAAQSAELLRYCMKQPARESETNSLKLARAAVNTSTPRNSTAC